MCSALVWCQHPKTETGNRNRARSVLRSFGEAHRSGGHRGGPNQAWGGMPESGLKGLVRLSAQHLDRWTEERWAFQGVDQEGKQKTTWGVCVCVCFSWEWRGETRSSIRTCGKVSRELNYEDFGHQAQELELGLRLTGSQQAGDTIWDSEKSGVGIECRGLLDASWGEF